jgi:hypothetical protein
MLQDLRDRRACAQEATRMQPDNGPRDGPTGWDPYVANRVAFLAKALMDHSTWGRSLDAAGEGAALAVSWVDGDGRRHTTVVDRAFLDAHLRVLRSLMGDLSACGEVGALALRGLFARQLAAMDEGEAG